MGRALKLVAVTCVGLLLGLVGYGVLVRVGVIPPPKAVVKGDVDLARSNRPGLRVLFVGNSLTYYNDMPQLVHRFAVADRGARPIYAVEWVAGGSTLRRASKERSLRELLGEVDWDVVVLQEQSQIPSFPASDRAREFTPYVRELADVIRRRGAEPLLFVTWAHRTGDRRNVAGDTYSAMQARVDAGYLEAARAAQSAIAPVGAAWREALERRPHLSLWAADGTHPSPAGSYLAACVFYSVLTRKSPVGNSFTAGLQPSLARFLQRVSVTG